MQPVDGAGAGAGELVAALGQQPQRRQLSIDGDFRQGWGDGDDEARLASLAT